MKDKSSELLVERVVNELTQLRKAQGLSHEKLAEKTGLSRPAISFIESHKRVPTILTCAKIAKALGARLADIIDKFER
jgi:transcriptional regulator with XRE-family HTH domain